MSKLPEDIFNDALDLPPDQRKAFLDSLLAPHDPQRVEIEALLAIAVAHPEMLSAAGRTTLRSEIGGYTIVESCGAGGMGEVYKARDRQLDRLVAVKVLSPPQLTATCPRSWVLDARARLEREARCLASLNHPNVATIYSLGYDDGAPFLVMELIEGQTLAQLLEQDALRPTQKLRLCWQVACGVEAAHHQGIIHRDLKPANVVVTRDGTAKVLDFGIAKVAAISAASPGDGCCPRLSEVAITTKAGTPGYMSPEQSRGLAVDHRSDIWAYGCLLQDCFHNAGADGHARSKPSRGSRVKLRAAGLSPVIRSRLQRLTEDCLRPNPQQRPDSMAVVRAELEKMIAIQRILAPWRRWTYGVGLGGLLMILVLILRSQLGPGPIPIAARAVGQHVEARYADGTRRLLLTPQSMDQDIAEALVARAGPGGAERVVLAWTGSTGGSRNHLFAWAAGGQFLQAIPATDDWPFAAPPDSPFDIYSRKRFAVLFPPAEGRSTLIAIEYSRYFPAVLRTFELAESPIRETYRLYHSGHISSTAHSPGLDGSSRWVWLAGRIRDGGLLRRVAGGIEQNTHFLTCFPDTCRGTSFFPPWITPADDFLAGHPDAPRPATPDLYFVVRGAHVRAGRVRWSESKPLLIDDVFDSDPGVVGILFGNSLRLDLHADAPGRIRVSATAAGELAMLIQHRAEALGAPFSELFKRFVADSLLTLVVARRGWEVTGDFRDARGRLPVTWQAER